MAETEQDAVVAALANGAALGLGDAPRQIDTHMSRVFLTPDRAYKLKRARWHPFADLSSVDQRRAMCEAELAANQRLAAPIYERVAPLARDPEGRIVLDGAGEIVDWVVVMRRLPDGAILSDMAAAGRLGVALIEQVAETIAEFHNAIPPAGKQGSASQYADIIGALEKAEMEGARALGLSAHSKPLFQRLDRELRRLAPRLKARRREGWVRRGHGDLHLSNICVHADRPMLFDALEFDPALATTDVLYDFAFLLMDLMAKGLKRHANAAMNRYWDFGVQGEHALALLPFFMSLRAAVRMAVAVEAGALADAQTYRELGLTLLANTSSPGLVAIGGLSGVGKTAVAKAVAPGLSGPCGARLLRSDILRKTLLGRGPKDRLGPEGYTSGHTAQVYRKLAANALEAAKAGVSVVADATFREPWTRVWIAAAADGYDFHGIWLRADREVRLARVADRAGDASDADVEVAASQVETHFVDPDWTTVDAAPPVAEVAAQVNAVLVLIPQGGSPDAQLNRRDAKSGDGVERENPFVVPEPSD